MSLFKKSNRRQKNQRTRVEDSDEDKTAEDHSHLDLRISCDIRQLSHKNDNNFDTISDNLIKLNDNTIEDINESKSKTKSIPKLSFNDEEEECDVFKVKKSSYSRRMGRQTDNRKIPKKKDIKSEVKKEINEENNEFKDKPKDDLNVIWIKSEEIKENKIEETEEMKIFAGDQIESDSEYEEQPEEYNNNEPFHHFRGALERGVIPDAKTIYELKKQRQLARDVEELIIPIEDDDMEEVNDSRIIRDDDNDKSDEEEDDRRISFAINRDDMDREKAKEAFRCAQEENEDMSTSSEGSEDELDRWEREQIKKGVRMPVHIRMLMDEKASISGLFTDNHTVVDMDIERPLKPKKTSFLPPKLLKRFQSSVAIVDVVERVKDQLKTMKESMEAKERLINTLTVDRNQCQQRMQTLSEKREQLIETLKKQTIDDE